MAIDMLIYGVIPILGVPIFGPLTAICGALTKDFAQGHKSFIVIGRISQTILFSCIASFMLTGFIFLVCAPFIVRGMGLKIMFFLFQLAILVEFGARALIIARVNPWTFSKKTDGRLTWLIVQPLKLIIGPNVVK